MITNYIVTKKETVVAKLEPETEIAISLFRKMIKTENRVEKILEQLDSWVAKIPQKDMAHYVAITTEIENGNL